ncbi:hypothetical protein BJ165DRAFT_1614761 [Panaeolus papilionaceus]|nr:hypothetical protein BJ165DRAFT_1614761 [Panaeolus papilionaceus]
MATTSKTEYKAIQVTGAVSVERADTEQRPSGPVLIMGPTGAGKSSFIEVLGLKGSSKISSNGLDGYTQTVSTYKLNNVTRDGRPIYLVDLPGFADTKILELAIVSMLQKWIKDNGLFSRILYMTPITSTRLPGTQRQVLKTFHALTGVATAKNVMIVTTMWDNIWGKNATKHADDNYQQLQNDIWKDFIEEGAQMSQFYNTQKSALSILDQVFQKFIGVDFSIEDHRTIIKGSPFESNLLTDLQDRIQNLQSHIPTLCDELAHAKSQGDQLLLSTLHPRLQEAKEDLSRFEKELDEFNALPAPSEDEEDETSDDEEASYNNDANSEIEVVQEVKQESKQPDGEQLHTVGTLSITAAHIHPMPVIPTSPVTPIAPLVLHTPFTPEAEAEAGTSLLPFDDQPITLTDNHPRPPIPTNSPSGLQEVPPALPQQIFPMAGAPSRFVQVMRKFKCWGDAAADLYEN